MPENLENSAVATGLEKVSFHSNPQEKEMQKAKWLSKEAFSKTTAEFSKFAGILSAALSQHHLLGFEIAQLEFHHLH